MRKARRGRGRMTPLARLLAVVSGVLAITALVLLGNYLLNWNRTNQEQAANRALYTKEIDANAQAEEPLATPEITAGLEENEETTQEKAEEPTPLSEPAAQERSSMADRFLPLMRRNQDVVGWLTYSMFSEMDFAVVQRDNEYYIDRAFSGERNLAGTVFLDETNSIRPRDKNLILHGHNMKNGTMFGRLARMMEPAVIKAAPLFPLTPSIRTRSMCPTQSPCFPLTRKAPTTTTSSRPTLKRMKRWGNMSTGFARALSCPSLCL